GEIAHPSARLGHEQRAGRDVPRREVNLEEAVEDAGRGVCEIERRRSRAADALRDRDYILEDADVDLDVLLRAKRKSGREKRSLDADLIRDVHPLPVAKRARAALGGEEEIPQRLVDDTGDDVVAVAKRNRDRP